MRPLAGFFPRLPGSPKADRGAAPQSFPRGSVMQMLLQDLRYAARVLRRAPGFTVLAVLALALGVGANTAIFTVVNAVLLRPFPFKDSERLVVVWDQLRKLGLTQFPVTFANYFDYRDQNRVFEDVAAFQYTAFNLSEQSGQPERISAMRVSANLFPLLGAAAAAGRVFASEENQPGRDNVVVVSHALWRRRFGADLNVIGKTVMLDGNLFTVIGIMPAGFEFSIQTSTSPGLWLPLAFRSDPARLAGGLQLLARLKDGASLEQAQANLKAVAGAIEQQYHPYRGPRGEDAGYGVVVVPLREQIFGQWRKGLLVLMGAVGFVLLIACANVANLLLARAAGREKEIAIRSALGASRSRLVRQFLTESMLLALLGGAGGLALAYGGVDLIVALGPYKPGTPLGPDSLVLGFTLLLSLVTGLLFGLIPAFSADVSPSRRPAVSASRLLIASEVALSLVLVAGAGLLVKSFLRLESVNPGFRAERVLAAQASLPQPAYRERNQISAFYQQLMEQLGNLPGVESASMASRLPLGGGRGGDPFSIEGRPYDSASKTPQVVNSQVAGPNYFRTMGIPLLTGRDFTERDAESGLPVVIINETMARGFWHNEDPLGKRIVLGAPRPGAAWLTIAGVVGDVKNASLDVAPLPQMYVPHSQNPSRSMTLVVRTAASPMAMVALVRSAVAAIDKNQPIYDVITMEQRLSASVAQPRFQSTLLGVFAGIALLLATVGIYGVVAHGVARRTREIGIRMALGAQRWDVLRLVIGESMGPALIGLAAGVAATFALGRALGSLLYEVTPTDPATLAGASLLLLGAALVACYLPARRATRIEPMSALRQE